MRDNGGERWFTSFGRSEPAGRWCEICGQARTYFCFELWYHCKPHIRARYARVLVFYAKKHMATLFGLHSCLVHFVMYV